MKKKYKMNVLAGSDKETIEVQQITMNKLRTELEDRSNKYLKQKAKLNKL